jgi:carbamoyltransferase
LNWILGLGGSDHDFSATLACDNDIRVAIEQERLSRRKHGISHWYEDPVQRSIDYCLSAEDISMSEMSAIVSSDLLPARVKHNLRDQNLKIFPHHLCHAASAYLMLPAGKRAGIVVYDGFGSIQTPDTHNQARIFRETFSFFLFNPDGYECIGQTFGLAFVEHDDFPTGVTNSIGMLYELVTSILGFDLTDSGKTMGLAAYGSPIYLDALEEFVSYGDTVANCFNCALDQSSMVARIEKILREGNYTFTTKSNIAASLQAIVNRTLLHCAGFFTNYNIDYLCIAGGCGLNTVANSHLIEHSVLNVPVFIPPYCDDAGIAFGALWLDCFNRYDAAPQLTFRGNPSLSSLARPGRRYTRDECRLATQEFYPRLVEDLTVSSAQDVAELISEGQIIGILNGRSEIGPRALGGRSILADPRSIEIRERLNRFIKKREPFRPLGPMILQSDYDKYFHDSRCADPFMLKVARARERCLREAPAVVHVDRTARVQVVPDDGDAFLVELLCAFRKKTGCPILLNTSFNRQGEPIVESPADAIDAFLGMKLDGLYLQDQLYRSADAIRPNSSNI